MSNPFAPIIPAVFDGVGDLPKLPIEANDLIARWSLLPQTTASQFCIAETRFGMGLNFLLTWQLWEQHAPKNAQLRFFSCSLHPLSKEDLRTALSAWPSLTKETEALIDAYPILTPGFHHLSFANGRVQLTLMLGNMVDCYEQLLHCADGALEQKIRCSYFDAWYLDGHETSSESESLCKIIALLSKENTTERLRKRHTPWHVAPSRNNKNRTAVVLGAGLAGCFTANSLSRRGWQVTLIDALPDLACAASGNQHAVFVPHLSAYRSPLTQFMLSAYLYASGIYKDLLKTHNCGSLQGALQLKAPAGLNAWLAHYPELAVFVDEKKASQLAGVSINTDALFLPSAGFINSAQLCTILVDTKSINIQTNTHVNKLVYADSLWHADKHSAEVLILANGHQFSEFEQTQHIPLKPIRGQTSYFNASGPRIPICGEGHVVPVSNGLVSVGATYELFKNNSQATSHDDALNYHKLLDLLPGVHCAEEVRSNWCSVRGATADYLPLVGPVPNAEQFINIFQGLASDSNRWIPQIGAYHPGLYAIAGFGSRGLTSIPLSAEYLAGLINQEFPCLPRNLIQAISPARFLRKSIIQKDSSLIRIVKSKN